MNKSWLLIAFLVVPFLCQTPNAQANVGGVDGVCESGGSLYTNLTGISMSFELSVSNGCATTLSLSWTDANGHAQTVTVLTGSATSISSSLRAGGAVSWSISGTGGVQVTWDLERAPAQSVAGGLPTAAPPSPLPCGSGGTFYSNLRPGPVTLDLSAVDTVASGCALTVSWTDAGGHAQTISLNPGLSEGVSTTLPSGGAISWTSATNGGTVGLTWQLERVVTTKLW